MQLVGSLLQIQGVSALEQLRKAPPGSLPDMLAAAQADFSESDRWRRDSANDFHLATLSLRMALPGDEPGESRALAETARLALERGLREAPGNAEAWIRLAQARLGESGPSQPAVDAFRMSLALARYEPSLLVWRCQVGLAVYPLLGDNVRQQLSEQIRMLAAISTDDLARVARASGRVPIVVVALSKDIATLRRFSWSIETIR